MTDTTLNIYQRMHKVMADAEYVQKKKADKGSGVRYDDVAAMLNPLFIHHGIVMSVTSKGTEHIGGLSGGNQKLYQSGLTVRFVNIDSPADYAEYSCEAHGMDGGDKAPGKIYTYGVKMILTKAFLLESGIDEESRAEKQDRMNPMTLDSVDKLSKIINGSEELWAKLQSEYRISALGDLPQSKFSEVKRFLNGLSVQASSITDDRLNTAIEKINAGKYTVRGLLDNFQLTEAQKALVASTAKELEAAK